MASRFYYRTFVHKEEAGLTVSLSVEDWLNSLPGPVEIVSHKLGRCAAGRDGITLDAPTTAILARAAERKPGDA